MKSVAEKACEIKLTPRIFQAPGKLNVVQVRVNQTALKYVIDCFTAGIMMDQRF